MEDTIVGDFQPKMAENGRKIKIVIFFWGGINEIIILWVLCINLGMFGTLDGEKASEILKNLFLLVIEWILNFKCLSIILLLLKYQN